MGATEKLDKLKAQIDREFKPMGDKYGCKNISELNFVYANADFLEKYGSISTIFEGAANVFEKLGFVVTQKPHNVCGRVWEIRVPEEEANKKGEGVT